MQKAVGLFKYQSTLSLARPFERRLFNAFAAHFDMDGIHLIVPIPLHRSKVKKARIQPVLFSCPELPPAVQRILRHTRTMAY